MGRPLPRPSGSGAKCPTPQEAVPAAGTANTPAGRLLPPPRGGSIALGPGHRAQKILAGTPAGRMGRPDELEGALLFLVNNEAAGFINGIVLPVDGGFQAYSGV